MPLQDGSWDARASEVKESRGCLRATRQKHILTCSRAFYTNQSQFLLLLSGRTTCWVLSLSWFHSTIVLSFFVHQHAILQKESSSFWALASKCNILFRFGWSMLFLRIWFLICNIWVDKAIKYTWFQQLFLHITSGFAWSCLSAWLAWRVTASNCSWASIEWLGSRHVKKKRNWRWEVEALHCWTI